ncbi:MAG TPA: BON domain-containing protein [Casimicrobiaceae bacterium]|jgi:hypothetical protein|nr:BON domain-containing protein [Casimicrobiaceae bacterium]
MKPAWGSHRTWITAIGSAILGAAAMYFLDRDKGRRRRAIGRDKARSFIANVGYLMSIAAQDAAHRIQGIRARARRRFKPGGAPDDLVLIERVRAKMGRVVSHPHAIQVGAYKGRVTLSGPILAGELQQLLDMVRSVQGAFEVENHLVVHERPGSISSLQGNSARPGTRSQITQEKWTPALRVATVLGGSLLVVYGMRYRNLTGVVIASIGLGLTARGAANVPMNRLPGFARGRRTIELRNTTQLGHRSHGQVASGE